MITPEPCAPPLPPPMVTWMATTEACTALETACQSGSCDDEPETGTVSLLSWPIVARDAGRPVSFDASSEDSVYETPAVAIAAMIAAAAAAEVTGIQVRRLRSVTTCVGS